MNTLKKNFEFELSAKCISSLPRFRKVVARAQANPKKMSADSVEPHPFAVNAAEPSRSVAVEAETPDANPSLSLFVGTWNMFGQPPPADLAGFIPDSGEFDLLAIGTEECGRGIEASVIFPGKEEWESRLCRHLGAGYAMVGAATCGATHLAVFLRTTLVRFVSDADASHVVTGIGNLIANKAGVAVAFALGQTPFIFLNAHFQAEQNAVQARNADFHRINNEMRLACVGNGSASGSIVDRFDRVFWSGDLNYRVQTTRKMADHVLKNELFEVMLANDQLGQELKAGRVFAGFAEQLIAFPPTYKYDPHSDKYDSSAKARVPSWTDRILYRPRPEIRPLFYDAVQSIRTSDHKPVVAHFQVEYAVRMVADMPNNVDDIPELPSEWNWSSVCSIM